ncbi:MAG: DUF4166 domain-containing protein [Parasphingorhabdus sp.]|uniref:SDR family oxidoreductase n=1 Tax=Parasphingorhabdus sp. TaxID=2709688 RepID=UPI003299FF99
MKTILLFGGYGGFGGRLSAELARRDYKILVAGRNIQKAEQFCEKCENCVPVAADRTGDISSVLECYQPDLIIDAAGPFQNSSDNLVQQSIAAKTAYLDLADSRAFVCSINRHSEAAISAGIPIISGASSVPALSGAVVRHLVSPDLKPETIDMAISASNRATAGRSVTEAILNYVGQPIQLMRGGRWQIFYGWQDFCKIKFDLSNGWSAGKRSVGLADVPDLTLLVKAFHPPPAVTFRAGTELDFQNRSLWIASWLIRWKWIKSLTPLSVLLLKIQNLTRAWGSDISAMKVEIYGQENDKACQKIWTLIARNGDGPFIPTFAAVLLSEKILNNQMSAGAYDAGNLLNLEEFQPLFDRCAIDHETRTILRDPSLYRRVIGPDYDHLPRRLQNLHNSVRDAGFEGEARVETGSNIVAKIAARLFGFPPKGTHDLHVHIQVDDRGENWTRSFSGRKFSSRLERSGQFLTERFGPFRFYFTLPVTSDGLKMQLKGWTFWRIPLPLFLAPQSTASEWEEAGIFNFDVPITLPLFGLMVHYRGWLKPVK